MCCVLVSAVPSLTFRAVVELVSGESRIFSGESIRLRCSIPDNHRSTWTYLWFRGSERLPQSDQHLVLWKARVQQSGKYYCQGLRDTVVGYIRTLQSLPVDINVDGKSLLFNIIRNVICSQIRSSSFSNFFSLTLFLIYFKNWELLHSRCIVSGIEMFHLITHRKLTVNVVFLPVCFYSVIFVQEGGLSCISHLAPALLDTR